MEKNGGKEGGFIPPRFAAPPGFGRNSVTPIRPQGTQRFFFPGKRGSVFLTLPPSVKTIYKIYISIITGNI